MLLYRLFLTFNATSWMIIIYAIKECWTISKIPYQVFGVALLAIPFALSVISIKLSKYLGDESPVTDCKEISLADGEFLPVYLGYFFVSVGVSEPFTMLIVYLMVFIFTFLSQTQYFNPMYLLLQYHYYHILTEVGTRIFVIKKGPVIRNVQDLEFKNLKRLNDTTFIAR